jgi:hypothetical protein
VAKIGGIDRETLRDWVRSFNASGPEGLIDNWTGSKPHPRRVTIAPDALWPTTLQTFLPMSTPRAEISFLRLNCRRAYAGRLFHKTSAR